MPSLKYLIIFSLVISTSLSAFAVPEKFVAKKDGFSISTPDNWQEMNNVLGVHFVMVSPIRKESQQRTVVQIVPMGVSGKLLHLEKDFNKDDLKGFIAITNKWSDRRLASIEGYDKYKRMSWPGIKTAQVLGVRVEALGDYYNYSNYFVMCEKDKQAYFIKTMVPDKNKELDAPIVDRIVESFACKE